MIDNESEDNRPTITKLLCELSKDGTDQKSIIDALYELTYSDLRWRAVALMKNQRADHTLRPTALMHEAYIKLLKHPGIEWQSRAHFFAVAARAMRQILVNHARDRSAAKRGGDWSRVTLDENTIGVESNVIEVLSVDEALQNLAGQDERMAKVVEMKVFGGMPAREVAHVLGVSKRTVDSDWKVARAWLAHQISKGA